MEKKIMDNKQDYFSQNEINKALLHCNWANRRMLIALIIVCITFISVVIINTVRETRWQDTVKELQSQMTTAIMEVQNGKTTD